MKIDDIKDVLDNQLGTIYKTILINGSWGIGKSHFIAEYSKNIHAYNVSLFGVNSIDDLKYCIAYAINSLDANNHKIMTDNDRITIQLPFLEISLPKLYKDFDSIIEHNLKDNKKHILVIDDLERKSDALSYKEIFGVITELSNINNLGIVVIVNDEFVSQLIEEDKKTYFDFNEKVIERTYKITSYSDEAVTNICKELMYEEGREYLKEAFINSGILNLRTLNKTLKFFNSIFTLLKTKEISSSHMNIIISCVLALIGTINHKNYSPDKKITDQVKSLFWNKRFDDKQNDLYIINILYDIYLSNDISLIDDIMQAFVVKEIIEPEKDLFYCSKEEIMDRANIFKEDVMYKYNPKYNLFSLIKDLKRFNDYMEKYDCSNKFTKKEIDNAVKLYANNYDLLSKDIYETVNGVKRTAIGISNEINESACMLIIKKYLNFYIDINVKEKEKYLSSNIDKLYSILTDTRLVTDVNEYKEELNKIIENNFFQSVDKVLYSFLFLKYEL